MKKRIIPNSKENKETYQHMFSEASFYNILDLSKKKINGRIDIIENTYPPVISFYGLKGGVGRSISLAYCADLLAKRGLKVAVIDFDFEAPGLHSIFGIENIQHGSLKILEDGNYLDRKLDIWDYLRPINRTAKGKIFLLPSGIFDLDYLERLDNLRHLLWNDYKIQPISRLLNAFDKETFDVILIDCRTGFNGITASLLYHYSDLVIALFPLSDQIWDGASILAKALEQTRIIRKTSPKWLIVPSMIPDTSEGQKLLSKYSERLLNEFQPDYETIEKDKPEESEEVAVLPNGIPYLQGIATEGKLPSSDAVRGSWHFYEPLASRIIDSLDLGLSPSVEYNINFSKILDETVIKTSDAFAESLQPTDILDILVPSEDIRIAIDPESSIVVGAKGSGKTLLWRCAVDKQLHKVRDQYKFNCDYMIGHPPKSELDLSGLSISHTKFEQIERKAHMRNKDTYESFWILYCLKRLCYGNNGLSRKLKLSIKKPLRRHFDAVFSMQSIDYSTLLNNQDVVDACENLLIEADKYLFSNNSQTIVLCYDGLDTDFQGTTSDWLERRQHFIKGLLLLLSDYRGRLHRIKFKIFLREDIYLSIEGLQNKSHLEAFKKTLHFQSRDLWRLALNLIVKYSPTFKEFILQIEPSAITSSWDLDESKLKLMLEPLWGRTLEKGKAAITTNYITRRTSDAQNRLFPRTLVHMLKEAFDRGKKAPAPKDRILSHQALRDGVGSASKQRTDDLTTEYIELKPYFDAMRGMKAKFTTDAFRKYMGKKLAKNKLALMHRPPGSWRKVLDALANIGLLSRIGEEEDLWSVALMYRMGLGVKSGGIH